MSAKSKAAPVAQKVPPSKLLQSLGARAVGSPRGRFSADVLSLDRRVDAIGNEIVGLSVDLTKVERPSRTYSPDIASVRLVRDEVLLIFAQLTLSEDELDSALVLRIPPRGIHTFLDSVDAMQNPSLDDIVKGQQIEAERLAEIEHDPKQMVKLGANVIHLAVSARETCLSFYQMSAESTATAMRQGFVDIEPIVRIDIKTAMFLGIRDALVECRHELPRQEEA